MKNKPYFPMFIDLSDKEIVVAGGGTVATRRVRTLLAFTRNIRVIAPKMTQEIFDLAKIGKIQLEPRAVKRTDFSSAYMVIAATGDRKVNDEIYRICKAEGIYVNVSSDKDKCDFYFPGVCMKEDMVIGVTASGTDHKKARELRKRMQKVLTEMSGEGEL